MTSIDKQQLDNEFKEIRNHFQTLESVPALVYHYTNSAGLLGILRSSSLWATHFRFLNDTSELHHGLNLASDVIEVTAEPQKKCFFLNAANLLDAAADGPISPYVVSFCADGNLLSQWRAYGDGGAGFSIGFDLAELSALFGNVLPRRITYEPHLQREILFGILNAYWDLLLQWRPKCEEVRFDSILALEGTIEEHCQAELVFQLLTELVRLKDPAFKEEQEYRLVRLGEGTQRRKFRSGRYGVVPYIELIPSNGGKLPIKKILAGSTADRSSTKQSVEMLLTDCGYTGVEVEVSTIPLR